MEAALAGRGLRLDRAGVPLHLRRAGGELELELGTDPSTRRRIPADGESCATLAETTALLVESWLSALPWRGSPGHAPPPATPGGGPGLALAAGAGGTVGLSPGPASWVVGGAATLAWPLGLQLELRALGLGRVRAAAAGGEVSYRRLGLALGAGYAPGGPGRGGPAAGLAFALDLVLAGAGGFTRNRELALLEPGVRAWGRYGWVLTPGLVLQLELALPLVGQVDVLEISPEGEALRTPRLWVELSALLQVWVF